MGKADLKVTVGLLVLGLALGALLLRVMNPPANPKRQEPGQGQVTRHAQATPRGPIPPSSPRAVTFQESLSSPPSNQELPQPLDQIPPLILQGNVLNVSAQDQTITIGSYRIEHNKAVLATQQTIGFTDETLFVRASSAGSEQPSETAINSQDLQEGDPVAIVAPRDHTADQAIAEKIILLDLTMPSGG